MISSNINVYTADDSGIPISDILEGLRARGVEASWERDDFFDEDDPLQAGTFTAPTGEAVEFSVQKIFEEEQEEFAARAAELPPAVAQLAGRLKNSYRLRATAPGRLLWTIVDTIAERTPSLIADADSDDIFDRDAFRAAAGEARGD